MLILDSCEQQNILFPFGIWFCSSALLFPGASKSVYAPEPFDVGRILQAEIIYDGQKIILKTTGAIDPGLLCWCFYAYFLFTYEFLKFLFLIIYWNFITFVFLFVRAAAGLGNYVEALVRKHDVEFNVCCPTSKNSPIYG